MDHFFGSTLFDNATIVRASSVGLADQSDNIQSFIGAVNITPLADLALGGGISSEPGAGRRNQTAGLWGSYTWGPLTAEAEFYMALSRENYVRQTTTTDPATGETTTTPVRLGQSFKEKQLTFGLYYRPIEKLELGVRYTRLLGRRPGDYDRSVVRAQPDQPRGRLDRLREGGHQRRPCPASTGTATSSAGARRGRRPFRTSTSCSARCR